MAMKKQELVHIHGLLKEVENHYELDNGEVIEHDQYSELGVQPTSLHRSKSDHKNAVFALANSITTAIEEGGKTDFDLDRHYEDLLEVAESKGWQKDSYHHLSDLPEEIPPVPVLRELDENTDIEYREEQNRVLVPVETVEDYLEGHI